MEDDEERIVRNPGRMIDACDAERNPLKEGPGRDLLRDQVQVNFGNYAKDQREADPTRWTGLTEEQQFAEFKAAHHKMLEEARKRGMGAFGRE